MASEQTKYTEDFTIENFLTVIPNPIEFFTKNRKIEMDTESESYALGALMNMYPNIPSALIKSYFLGKLKSVKKTIAALKKNGSKYNMRKARRKLCLPVINNVLLLQTMAFYQHEREIITYLSLNIKEVCLCCYDEEVVAWNIVECANGCIFCKSCVITSTEVLFAAGKLDFPCLMQCSATFTWQTMQKVLPPNLFRIIMQKKSLEELKEADIEGLEMCPFCDFAAIPWEGDKVFSCENPTCMKESCRQCKEPSHIPLRCDEVEKDEDIKARVFVENQMTEALLRKCIKCGIKFYKEEGCNMMTCSCGAAMCYICGKEITSYLHFRIRDDSNRIQCPLLSDTITWNKENVLNAARRAKAEVGELKIDPAQDVEEHYRNRAAAMLPLNEAGGAIRRVPLQRLN